MLNLVTTIVILGATLIDGSGRAPLRNSAVVLKGDSIVAVGRRGQIRIPAGAQVIDGRGMIVSPGFIDAHNHSDRGFTTDPTAASQVSQGITTVVIGQDAPYWQSSARGVIVGLTRYANKGHLARAALEATAYQTREVLEAMELDMKIQIDVLRTDGGMVVDDLLMQFQADILGRDVIRPQVKETTALGAAYAAALAVGFYKDQTELKEQWRIDRTWKPFMDAQTRETLFAQWKKAVSRSLNWID